MFHEWSLFFHSCWLEHSMENWLCFIRPNLFSLKCGIYPKGSVLTPSSPKLQTNEVLHQLTLRLLCWRATSETYIMDGICDFIISAATEHLQMWQHAHALNRQAKDAPSEKRPFELYIATRSHASIHILYTHYAVLCTSSYVYQICNIICSKVINNWFVNLLFRIFFVCIKCTLH